MGFGGGNYCDDQFRSAVTTFLLAVDAGGCWSHARLPLPAAQLVNLTSAGRPGRLKHTHETWIETSPDRIASLLVETRCKSEAKAGEIGLLFHACQKKKQAVFISDDVLVCIG